VATSCLRRAREILGEDRLRAVRGQTAITLPEEYTIGNCHPRTGAIEV